MLTWCMAHPYLTFILAGFALLVLDAAITNILNFGTNILRVILIKRRNGDE